MNAIGRLGYNALLLFSLLLHPALASAQVPEIPDPSLNDVAMVTWYNGPLPQFGIPFYSGPIIIFNPIVLSNVGPYLSAFFTAHEYCHINLNHIAEHYFLSNPFNREWMSIEHEYEADSCATQHVISQGNIPSAQAAANMFWQIGPIHVPGHPPGTERAQNIAATAMALGVQF